MGVNLLNSVVCSPLPPFINSLCLPLALNHHEKFNHFNYINPFDYGLFITVDLNTYKRKGGEVLDYGVFELPIRRGGYRSMYTDASNGQTMHICRIVKLCLFLMALLYLVLPRPTTLADQVSNFSHDQPHVIPVFLVIV
jgi:hypothetical protein